MIQDWDGAMNLALAEAESAAQDGEEVPVGAVLIDDFGKVIASGHNKRESNNDPTAHAEIVAIRRAAARLDSWRLEDATLVVTLEPCVMCAGAIVAARIPRVVFGAWDERVGAAGSLYDVLRDARLGHPLEVIGGVREEECANQLRTFFEERRRAAEFEEKLAKIAPAPISVSTASILDEEPTPEPASDLAPEPASDLAPEQAAETSLDPAPKPAPEPELTPLPDVLAADSLAPNAEIGFDNVDLAAESLTDADPAPTPVPTPATSSTSFESLLAGLTSTAEPATPDEPTTPAEPDTPKLGSGNPLSFLKKMTDPYVGVTDNPSPVAQEPEPAPIPAAAVWRPAQNAPTSQPDPETEDIAARRNEPRKTPGFLNAQAIPVKLPPRTNPTGPAPLIAPSGYQVPDAQPILKPEPIIPVPLQASSVIAAGATLIPEDQSTKQPENESGTNSAPAPGQGEQVEAANAKPIYQEKAPPEDQTEPIWIPLFPDSE